MSYDPINIKCPITDVDHCAATVVNVVVVVSPIFGIYWGQIATVEFR